MTPDDVSNLQSATYFWLCRINSKAEEFDGILNSLQKSQYPKIREIVKVGEKISSIIKEVGGYSTKLYGVEVPNFLTDDESSDEQKKWVKVKLDCAVNGIKSVATLFAELEQLLAAHPHAHKVKLIIKAEDIIETIKNSSPDLGRIVEHYFQSDEQPLSTDSPPLEFKQEEWQSFLETISPITYCRTSMPKSASSVMQPL